MKPTQITGQEFHHQFDELGRQTLHWLDADGWHQLRLERADTIRLVVTEPDREMVALINQPPPASGPRIDPQPSTTTH